MRDQDLSIAKEFKEMGYGEALESDAAALEWLEKNKRKFGHFIDGKFTKPSNTFKTTNPATVAPTKCGVVKSVDNTLNTINVDTTGFGQLVASGDFILYYKDVVANSTGARGYFMQFKLENSDTTPVELFSVGSSVMKSFP